MTWAFVYLMIGVLHVRAYNEEAVEVQPSGFHVTSVEHEVDTNQIVMNLTVSAGERSVPLLFLSSVGANEATLTLSSHPCEGNANDDDVCCLNNLISDYQVAPDMQDLSNDPTVCPGGTQNMTKNSLYVDALSSRLPPGSLTTSDFLATGVEWVLEEVTTRQNITDANGTVTEQDVVTQNNVSRFVYPEGVSYTVLQQVGDSYMIEVRLTHDYLKTRARATDMGSGLFRYEYTMGATFVELMSHTNAVSITSAQALLTYYKSDFVFLSISSEQSRTPLDTLGVEIHQATSAANGGLYQWILLDADYDRNKYPGAARIVSDTLRWARVPTLADATGAAWQYPCRAGNGYYYTDTVGATDLASVGAQTCVPDTPTFCMFDVNEDFFVPFPTGAALTGGYISGPDASTNIYLGGILELTDLQGFKHLSTFFVSIDLDGYPVLAHCSELEFKYNDVTEALIITARVGVKPEADSAVALQQTVSEFGNRNFNNLTVAAEPVASRRLLSVSDSVVADAGDDDDDDDNSTYMEREDDSLWNTVSVPDSAPRGAGQRQLLQTGGISVETEISDDSGVLDFAEDALTTESINTYLESNPVSTLPPLTVGELISEETQVEVDETLLQFSGASSYAEAALSLELDAVSFMQRSYAQDLKIRVDSMLIMNFLGLGHFDTILTMIRNGEGFNMTKQAQDAFYTLVPEFNGALVCDQVTSTEMIAPSQFSCFWRRAISDNVVSPEAAESLYYYKQGGAADISAAKVWIRDTMLGGETATGTAVAEQYFNRSCSRNDDALAEPRSYGCLYVDPGYRWISRTSGQVTLSPLEIADKTIVVSILTITNADGTVFRRRLLAADGGANGRVSHVDLEESAPGVLRRAAMHHAGENSARRAAVERLAKKQHISPPSLRVAQGDQRHEAPTKRAAAHSSRLLVGQRHLLQTQSEADDVLNSWSNTGMLLSNPSVTAALNFAQMTAANSGSWEILRVRALRGEHVSLDVYRHNVAQTLRMYGNRLGHNVRRATLLSVEPVLGVSNTPQRRLLSSSFEEVDLQAMLATAGNYGNVYEATMKCLLGKLAAQESLLSSTLQGVLIESCTAELIAYTSTVDGEFSNRISIVKSECGNAATLIGTGDLRCTRLLAGLVDDPSIPTVAPRLFKDRTAKLFMSASFSLDTQTLNAVSAFQKTIRVIVADILNVQVSDVLVLFREASSTPARRLLQTGSTAETWVYADPVVDDVTVTDATTLTNLLSTVDGVDGALKTEMQTSFNQIPIMGYSDVGSIAVGDAVVGPTQDPEPGMSVGTIVLLVTGGLVGLMVLGMCASQMQQQPIVLAARPEQKPLLQLNPPRKRDDSSGIGLYEEVKAQTEEMQFSKRYDIRLPTVNLQRKSYV